MAANLMLRILLCCAFMVIPFYAKTNEEEVIVLNNLYWSLNRPVQLHNWKGDPCNGFWMGIVCSRSSPFRSSSIIGIKLSGFNFTGKIGSLQKVKNLKNLDLSRNKIEGCIPKLPIKIQILNLSHNSLSGSLGDVFDGLGNLKYMDLSFNSFTGDLPISFLFLNNLEVLYLQSNRFTGSTNILDNLSLTDLNLEDNLFTGNSSSDSNDQIINLIEYIRQMTEYVIRLLERMITALKDLENVLLVAVPAVVAIATFIFKWGGVCLTWLRNLRVSRTDTVAELHSAPSSYSSYDFIGEGSLGSVSAAQRTDGKVVAVKNIKILRELKANETQHFFREMAKLSKLKHPNIVKLVSYYVDQCTLIIEYDYIESFSLDKALHCAHKRLNWTERLQIALGVARALNYMHSLALPISHRNLKAANILLDEEFKPHVCDCGLDILRPLTMNTDKHKDNGYLAPEQVKSSSGNLMTDVYAFGVLLLEIVTRRKPFDNTRAQGEQSLVGWAISKAREGVSLSLMVDPEIKEVIPPHSFSELSALIRVCVEAKPELRPPIDEVVERLRGLLEEAEVGRRTNLVSLD